VNFTIEINAHDIPVLQNLEYVDISIVLDYCVTTFHNGKEINRLEFFIRHTAKSDTILCLCTVYR